jgi:transcriptional regulator with XRE-family HTH domain
MAPHMDALMQAAEIEARALAAGLTIGDLCERAKIHRTTLWRWKRGDLTPGLDVYRRLVAVVIDAESASVA